MEAKRVTMQLIPFSATNNLSSKQMYESRPWEFQPNPEELTRVRAKRKQQRREDMAKPETNWNIYSPVRGLNPHLRVNDENRAAGVCGIAVDYDSRSDETQVRRAIAELDVAFQPTFLEISLSAKCRLVWVFEREVPIFSTDYCEEFFRVFFKFVKAETLLAGFDSRSGSPTQIWTNGGEWIRLNEKPISGEICFGITCDAARKPELYGAAEIPIETIASEVEKRYPGRWKGDFKLDAAGVRFWAPKADNERGCMVKPNGMVCFTGGKPFVTWADIFGIQWVQEQRVLALGKAAEGLFFDGKNYWEKGVAGVWISINRADAILRLKNRGISDKPRKGETVTDVERVLCHLQRANRVYAAAPLINYKPGVVELEGVRLLNTVNLNPVLPVKGTTGTPTDFPWLWKFLNGLFAHPELRPLEYFLAWTQRQYHAILNYERLMGQAIFLCGPVSNGKTLLGERVLRPLFGHRAANPFDYFTGKTSFNDDLFESTLLMSNDEDAPKDYAEQNRFKQRIKAWVVNPSQTHHAKFCSRVRVEWTGRIFVTCNDDAASVGILPEVTSDSEDKMMFFASQPYIGDWGNTEATLRVELPCFGWWLVNSYTPPQDILCNSRCGIKPFYDPLIRARAIEQSAAYNLVELLLDWVDTSETWGEPDNRTQWEGTPTKLYSQLSACEPLRALMKEWTVKKLFTNLTTLSRTRESGVEASNNKHEFRIVKEKLLRRYGVTTVADSNSQA
jgi:hypothetical protein